MLNCHEATRLMSEEQERELTPRERLELRFHNLICRGCSRYRRHIGFIRRATKHLRDGETP